jgi:hypothetical protein
MSAEALPFALLIVLVELAIGSLWVVLFSQIRGQSTPSFIKFCAATIFVMAGFAFWVAATINVGDEVDGYPLDPSYMPEARVALAVTFALCLPYAVFTFVEARRLGIASGAVASVAAAVAIALFSQVFALPTWGYVGTLLSFVIGALVVGAVCMGMVLGHWYLVTPRLPAQPLREMTGFLLVVMLIQALLIIPALALPRDSFPSSVDTPVLENTFFWMRIAGGLAFPALLAYMAFDSTGVRAMQSATGLLYIAMALVLSGEVVAKGIMFVSAVPN